MSDKSNPPKAAVWFLQTLCPGDNEALIGDLIERFREVQSRGWFWKQVVIAFCVGVLGEIRSHWPHFCYATAGVVLPAFLWQTVNRVPFLLDWRAIPWPWSQVILELSRPALLALAALPVLAAGLAIRGEFRWASLLRTGVINLTLITLDKYLRDFLGPWLSRPVPGNPNHRYLSPPEFWLLLFFSTFLIAAWLGCLSPPHPDQFKRHSKLSDAV